MTVGQCHYPIPLRRPPNDRHSPFFKQKTGIATPGRAPSRHAPMTDNWIVSVVEENPPGGEDLKEEEGYETV